MTSFPLSISQREIFLEHRMYPGSNLHSIGGTIRITGALQPALFTEALHDVLLANDVFGIRLRGHAGAVLQELGNSPLPVPVLDFSHDPGSLEAWMQARFETPLDIFGWPLFDFALIREGPASHVWFIKAHHIIIDGWGISRLGQAVAARYSALLVGTPPPPAIHLPYADFVARDNAYAGSSDHAVDARYWQTVMASLAPPVFSARTDASGPGGAVGDRAISVFHAADYADLTAFARSQGSSSFRVMVAAMYTLLSRLHAQPDLTFAYPVLNRDTEAERAKIGLFTRLLPLRIMVPAEVSFLELLAHIDGTVRENAAHKRFAVSELQTDPRGAGRMFDVVLSFERHDYDLQFGAHVARASSLSSAALPGPLAIFVEEFSRTGDVLCAFDYNLAYFMRADIDRLILQFRELLARCFEAPRSALRSFEIATPADIERVRTGFNRTAAPRPRHTRIIEAFEDQVRRHPDAPALVGAGRPLTYAELNRQADQLAGHLLAAGPLAPSSPVGILLERTHTAVVAILAVWKAGGFFVPVDPEYPESRLRSMLEDGGVQLIVTEVKHRARAVGLSGARLLLVDEPSAGTTHPPGPATPLAYLMYTSGSTGMPKGVLIGQAGVLNMSGAQAQLFRPGPDDRVLQFASLSFDASIFELCMALLSGAALVMAPRSVIDDPAAFGAFLDTHGVTVATLPPAYLRVMPRRAFGSLRILITAGEAPRLEDVAHYSSRVEYYNAYGPTEASVWTTVSRLHPEHLSVATCANIGRPIQNLSVWILDPHLKMMPVEQFGELCIGGIGLAEGYLNDTPRTNARFVAHPYQPGERLYRSGDRARWLTNGTLELSGRLDEQVKIRGYRIEPGEVEQHLRTHPRVADGVVVAEASGETGRELAACVVLNAAVGPDPSASDIRRHLQASLPAFMIPAVVCFMESLPLTFNGKVDRQALSERWTAGRGRVAPTDGALTPLEQTVAAIWRDVLPMKAAGVHENFFDLGGNSLHAIQIAARLSESTGAVVSARTVLTSLSASALASAVEREPSRLTGGIDPGEDAEACEMTAAQQQIWLAHELSPNKSLFNVQACYRITGSLDAHLLKAAVRKTVLRHEALRTGFVNVNGVLQVRVRDGSEVAFEVQEHDHAAATAGATEDLVASLDGHVFDLAEAPLVRATLIRCAGGEHLLVLVLHHLVCDWLSIRILQEEIQQLYRCEIEAGLQGPPPCPPELHAHAVRQRRHRTFSAEHERYWTGVFAERPQRLRLPLDFDPPLVRTHAGALYRASLPATLVRAVAEKARDWETTPYTVLLASLNVLFHKYSGQTDIVLGTILAGRESTSAERAVGCFMNTLAIRTRLQPSGTFAALVEQVKHLVLAAHEHQHHPLSQIVNRLNAQGGGAQGPLFNVMVDMLFIDIDERLELGGGAAMTPAVYDYRKSKYDLTLYILAEQGKITVLYEYSTEVFAVATIAALARRWAGLLTILFAEGGREIRDVPLDGDLGLPAIRRLRRV